MCCSQVHAGQSTAGAGADADDADAHAADAGGGGGPGGRRSAQSWPVPAPIRPRLLFHLYTHSLNEWYCFILKSL